MRKFGIFIVLLSFALIFSGSPVLAEEEVRYLKNNIHYQERPDRGGKLVRRASYANYTDPGEGHKVLPVNTKVEIKVKRGWRGKGIQITDLSDGKLIHFEYNKRNMKIPMADYIELISSPQKVSLKGLSQLDHKGIKNGKVYLGMSKKGVQMAFGYPATHRTPSLEDNNWTYWRNRFQTTVITFDSKGKVIGIR
jgi:hypothetical protein